ncbi:MAG: NOL1/NOP2/sun family putative RNA methylase [Candidatus Zixiibacteriota bacterium]
MNSEYNNNRAVELPDEFVERYGPLVDDPDAFFSCLKSPLPRAFRVNTLKSDRKEVLERFASYGIRLQQPAWYQDAFISPDVDPGPTLEHFLGKIYLQELTSMLPPLAVRAEIEEAQSVLDACAAPGSKATQIAALMNNNGTLVANDKDYNRIRGLKHNLSKAGAQNIVITNCDLGELPRERLYDVVLLDAPCSSDGTIRKNPAQLKRWTPRKSARYSSQQRFLIKVAHDLVKPGGVLLYSTCSFSPDENELVVDHLLHNRPAELERIQLENITLSPGIVVIDNQELSPEISRTARVWGHHNDTGGFYLARIRKPEESS